MLIDLLKAIFCGGGREEGGRGHPKNGVSISSKKMLL